MMGIKLKPCPFCGGMAQLYRMNIRDPNGGLYYIACPHCDARFSFEPGMCVRTYTARTVEDAANLWNRRPKYDHRKEVTVDADV